MATHQPNPTRPSKRAAQYAVVFRLSSGILAAGQSPLVCVPTHPLPRRQIHLAPEAIRTSWLVQAIISHPRAQHEIAAASAVFPRRQTICHRSGRETCGDPGRPLKNGKVALMMPRQLVSSVAFVMSRCWPSPLGGSALPSSG